jgi:hypothetical protein
MLNRYSMNPGAYFVVPFVLVSSLVACSGDALDAVSSDADASADGGAAPTTDLAGETTADPSAPAPPPGTPDVPSSPPDPVDVDGGSADGGVIVDGAAGDAARGDAGGRAFGEPCSADAQCTSKACFRGGAGGGGGGGGGGAGYCSILCTPANAATTCPKPLTSGQCNARGYCKRK